MAMQKKTMIKKIKAVISEYGPFSIGELDQATNSPIVSSIGKYTSVCIDTFNSSTVGITTYVNEIETETDVINYEDLSKNLLIEVYEIVVEIYEVEQTKLFNSCKNENY